MMAKVTKSAIEKRLTTQYNREPSQAEVSEALIRKFKKDVKKEGTLDYVGMHRYFLSKKEKRIYKSKLNQKRGR
jgi:ribosomal protein S21